MRGKQVKRKTATQHAKKQQPKAVAHVYIYKKELGKAPETQSFVLKDGRKLKTMYELIDELETMPDETFREHVNEWKNDFATWIKDVFQAPNLADEIRHIQNRIETQRHLLKHFVRELKKIAEKK